MNRFNHARMIEDTQPAYFKSIQPGMVLTFKYVAENISDKSPLSNLNSPLKDFSFIP